MSARSFNVHKKSNVCACVCFFILLAVARVRVLRPKADTHHIVHGSLYCCVRNSVTVYYTPKCSGSGMPRMSKAPLERARSVHSQRQQPSHYNAYIAYNI